MALWIVGKTGSPFLSPLITYTTVLFLVTSRGRYFSVIFETVVFAILVKFSDLVKFEDVVLFVGGLIPGISVSRLSVHSSSHVDFLTHRSSILPEMSSSVFLSNVQVRTCGPISCKV